MSNGLNFSKIISPEIINKIIRFNAELPEVDNINTSDLISLGQVQEYFSGLKNVFDSGLSELSALCYKFVQFTEAIILDSTDNKSEAISKLQEILTRLKSISLTSDNTHIFSDIIAISDVDRFFKADVKTVQLSSPPMGILTVNSSEDVVVYNEFVSESGDHIDNVESDILSAENTSNIKEKVDNIFRAFHSIKGAAGFLGLTAINKLCHECENTLDNIRKNVVDLTPQISDALLAASDVLRKLFDILEECIAEENNGMAIPDYDIMPILDMIKSANNTALDDFDTDIDRDIVPGKIGGILVNNGIVSEADLKKALKLQNRQLGDIVVDMGVASQQQIEDVIRSSGEDHKKRINSIKVDTDKLEVLLEMAGELVVAHSQVANYKALDDEKHREFYKNVANMGKISNNLQENIMALRLIPLRSLFGKMTRLVRDTAKKTGKHAILHLSGEDTEIDKTVIEQIADPLVHLLRNAVDHGIEESAVREKMGKNPAGHIRLSAYHAGGNIIIEIADDGKGINAENIYNKALNKNFIRSDVKMTDAEILDLIFLPGFSTRDVATDISGRGVGMDVVKKNISDLGGRIEVSSTEGAGTTFIIRLPLTMAIVDGMIVDIADQKYVLPTLNIVESIKPKKEDVISINGKQGRALQVRGELVPLIELSEIFHLESYGEITSKIVIIVKNGNSRCGLIINEVQQQQQVVIKNLGKQLQGVQGVSGGCILGNGRVGLILDIPSLIKLANNSELY